MTQQAQIRNPDQVLLSALCASSAVNLLSQFARGDADVFGDIADVFVRVALVPGQHQDVVQRLSGRRVVFHFVIDRSLAGKIKRKLAVTEGVLFLKYLTHKGGFYDVTRG